MTFTFKRMIMKTAMETCKTIAKDKEAGLVWFLTAGKEGKDLFLYTNRNNQEVKYFHHMKLLSPVEEEISFLINPFLLDEALKTGTELEWKISEDKEKLICGDLEFPIRWFEGKFPIEKMNYTPLKDSESFIETIETMNKMAGKSVFDFTIGAGEVTLRAPIYIKRFSFDEQQMPSCTIFPEMLTMFKKTLIWKKNDEKKMYYAGNHKELVIKNELTPVKKVKKESVLIEEEAVKQLFIFQNQANAQKVKNLEGETVHTFTINPDEILEALQKYKKPVEDVYLYDLDGKLCIDPYDKGVEAIKEEVKVEEIEEELLEPEELIEEEEEEDSDDTDLDKKPKVKRTNEKAVVEEEEQPLHYIRYDGEMKRTKIDLEGAIAFFEGFTEKTEQELKRDEYRKALEKIKDYESIEENVLNVLLSYNNKIKTFSMYVEEEMLCLDPYHKKGMPKDADSDSPQIFRFPYTGKTKLLKVDVKEMIETIKERQNEAKKTVFEPKPNALSIEIKKFIEEEEEYYYFTSKSSLFYSILLAKKEPNYVKVQKKVDEIFEEQKKIAYLQ